MVCSDAFSAAPMSSSQTAAPFYTGRLYRKALQQLTVSVNAGGLLLVVWLFASGSMSVFRLSFGRGVLMPNNLMYATAIVAQGVACNGGMASTCTRNTSSTSSASDSNSSGNSAENDSS